MTIPPLLDGRYEVIEPVSSGAMGCVYRARDTRLGTIVAVKHMKMAGPETGDEGYGERRFREEARLLSTLRHRGLPRVTDFFIDKTEDRVIPCLIMEFIDGVNGETMMAGRNHAPLPLPEALMYGAGILDILCYLHSFTPPIIYRDLNPRNIMVRNHDIFLVDFGIARVFEPSHRGTAIGTPGYAAPEQYMGRAEPRSDLFSCGVLLHYFLSGRDPEREGQGSFIYEPLRKANPWVPEGLESLILSMVHVVPDMRPHDAAAALREIRQLTLQMDYSPPVSIHSFRNIYRSSCTQRYERCSTEGDPVSMF